jgi:ubiquitin-protein ligase
MTLSICLDILQNQWSPICDISIFSSIQSLLCDPSKLPYISEAVVCTTKNVCGEYCRRVREVVGKAGFDDES